MSALHYRLADVFTDTPLSGNPLAVFPVAPALDTVRMQAIAAELNLSETVFVYPPRHAGHAARLRIFTPRQELPFAGHPTIGTALVLAALRGLAPDADGCARLVLEENVGPVPVVVRFVDGRPAAAQFTTAQRAELGATLADPAALAAALSLAVDDLLGAARIASCGVPFLCAPLRDVDALGRAAADAAALLRLLVPLGASGIYLYARTDVAGCLRTRMFAPEMGLIEDPATGAAAAALCGVLAEASGVADGRVDWTLLQGVEMGRRSRIDIEAERVAGATVAVRVAGGAVLIGGGELLLG